MELDLCGPEHTPSQCRVSREEAGQRLRCIVHRLPRVFTPLFNQRMPRSSQIAKHRSSPANACISASPLKSDVGAAISQLFIPVARPQYGAPAGDHHPASSRAVSHQGCTLPRCAQCRIPKAAAAGRQRRLPVHISRCLRGRSMAIVSAMRTWTQTCRYYAAIIYWQPALEQSTISHRRDCGRRMCILKWFSLSRRTTMLVLDEAVPFLLSLTAPNYRLPSLSNGLAYRPRVRI